MPRALPWAMEYRAFSPLYHLVYVFLGYNKLDSLLLKLAKGDMTQVMPLWKMLLKGI